MTGAPELPLHGHRPARLGHSPFGDTAPTVLTAVAYAVVAGLLLVAPDAFPGARWLPVHLFTLGVLTNLVLVFSQHFGRTLTRSPAAPVRWYWPTLNLGILLVVVGRPTEQRWTVAAGGTIVTAVVVHAYRRLRRLRRDAVGARFDWIVRTYERAHGAFIHGALLGVLMGTGVLAGAWYGPARLAHLHANVLGWGGLTLLATLVFFGPTMVRTRIVAGADDRAAFALRIGATSLTVGVLLLLATGVGGWLAAPLRVTAGLAVAVLAWAATVCCLPVARAAREAKPSAARWPVIALSWWFPAVVWADALVVATGTWRHLDAVGIAVILGVLAQTILAVLVYLAPMFRGRSFAGRDVVMARFERGATVRAVAFNAGVAALVLAAVERGEVGSVLARSGGMLIVSVVVWLLVAGLAPIRAGSASDVRSAVARRYRG